MALSIIKAIILAIVEGLTEFLPISSTGHLIILNQFFSFDAQFTKLFDIFIQLGAILSVVVYFRKKLWPFKKNSTQAKSAWDIWKKAIVGVLPAIVLGLLLGNFIEDKLFNPWVVAGALLIGGVIILYIEKKKPGGVIGSVADLSYKTAFMIGLIQCLAMIPGTSRSASTIIGALLLGATHLVAVEFSFFLAIPTMVAASGYSLLKHGLNINFEQAMVLLVGFAVAFITALLAVKFLLNYIQKKDFKLFGYYRLVLGAVVLLWWIWFR